MSATPDTPADPSEPTHADHIGDLLYGAAQIAQFLFGDAKQRRKVYYLVESSRLPVFRLGSICARKSTLIAWIAEQERCETTQLEQILTNKKT